MLKLVIVDDEPIQLEGLIRTYDWKSMGFEVAGSARSGEEALRVIREKKPQVVLSDIRMKQVTGLMVMEEIRKEGMDCLFIFLSAYRDFEYARKACNLGAFDYLLKPVDDEKLRETMEKAREVCGARMEQVAEMAVWEKQRKISDVSDEEVRIIDALRAGDGASLKKAFEDFILSLPSEEEVQQRRMHRLMLRAEFMLEDSGRMNAVLRRQFRDYYASVGNLAAVQTVDVCYRLLERASTGTGPAAGQEDTGACREYLQAAVAYIEEHLGEEDLSIVSVATYVYLNPVYFGRVFKNATGMTFKQYLLKRRMERARTLLDEGKVGIATVGAQVGIGNPSYFSRLFREYTGKLPSEYKKGL